MSEKANAIIEVKHMTKQFSLSKHRRLTACDDISLTIYKNQTLGIVGESGCGKSTLMRIVMGLEKPTSGEILFHGENIAALTGEVLRLNRRKIQMVFQNPTEAFHPRMRVKEIICEPLLNFKLISKKDIADKAGELLEMVELPRSYGNRFPREMSGGERQRVGIARALALEPEVIICDEATSALDVSVQKTIIELLMQLQQKKHIAIVFICHDLALVQQFADRIAVMYLGNIVEVINGRDVAGKARNPYTQSLLEAVFDLQMDFDSE